MQLFKYFEGHALKESRKVILMGKPIVDSSTQVIPVSKGGKKEYIKEASMCYN